MKEWKGYSFLLQLQVSPGGCIPLCYGIPDMSCWDKATPLGSGEEPPSEPYWGTCSRESQLLGSPLPLLLLGHFSCSLCKHNKHTHILIQLFAREFAEILLLGALNKLPQKKYICKIFYPHTQLSWETPGSSTRCPPDGWVPRRRSLGVGPWWPLASHCWTGFRHSCWSSSWSPPSWTSPSWTWEWTAVK
jgi:hypothetical protein